MPPKHQKFIKWIEQRSSAITKSIELTPGYDDTLGAIRKFREIHLNTVSFYLFFLSKKLISIYLQI